MRRFQRAVNLRVIDPAFVWATPHRRLFLLPIQAVGLLLVAAAAPFWLTAWLVSFPQRFFRESFRYLNGLLLWARLPDGDPILHSFLAGLERRRVAGNSDKP